VGETGSSKKKEDMHMHKKQIALLMAGLMTVSSLTMGSVTVMADDDPVELYFMFNGPEYTDAYHDLIDHYTEEHPNVSIELEVLQNDYQTVLRSRLNSGEVPDLFLSSAYSDNTLYADYIYNLDDEEFMKNFSETTLTSVTEDGHITGMPFLVQSHGFIYNKALFEQAGITELPTTLDELRTVCEKLTDAGIQPFSSGFGEWWILPQTVYPSMSDAYDGDYDKLFEDVKKGDLKFGELPQVDFALDLLDLIKEYSGDKPMESTNDLQCSDFATGKVAMIHNGSWDEASIRAIAPDIDMGYVYMPRMDEKAVLAVESNLTFRVAKDSENLDTVLDFLNYMCTSDYGRSWVPSVIGDISPLTGADAPDTQLAAETAAAQDNSVTCPWWIFKGPEGVEEPFGTAFQNYVAGNADRDETKEVLTQLFVDAYDAM
jgi:raffinose/stachyose/melibiose transport system substrate-binding protein